MLRAEDRLPTTSSGFSLPIKGRETIPSGRVRARLTARPEDWPWSSTRAHLSGVDDGLVRTRPILDRVEDFAALIAAGADDLAFARLRAAESTGRPVGTTDFVADLERRLGRPLARRAPGRKAAGDSNDQLALT